MKRNICELNRIQLIDEMKMLKKLDYIELSTEEFGIKDYFLNLNLELSRVKFRARSFTMTSCATHYPNNEQFIKSMFECHHKCGNVDSLLHWQVCIHYSHLAPANLEDDRQLCQFYLKVIKLRSESQ